MNSVTTINTSHHVLDRQFFLTKIQQEIESFEKELYDNIDELACIKQKVKDMKPECRNKSNPDYLECWKRRSKLNHRNATVHNILMRLHEEYNKYQKIEI